MTEADADISSLVKFNGYAETLGKVFDVVKKSANGVDYVILGLENQSKIHYAMPLRHMIGDAFSYLKEYKELEAKNKNIRIIRQNMNLIKISKDRSVASDCYDLYILWGGFIEIRTGRS